jgi:hypothetical protein
MTVEPTTAALIFEDPRPERVRRAVRELGGAIVPDLTQDLNAAFHGSCVAAGRYVIGYRRLASKLLHHAAAIRPDIVGLTAEGDVVVLDGKAGNGPFLPSVLADASSQAPFSPFSGQCELGDAVALDLTNRTRAVLGYQALVARVGENVPHEMDDVTARRFMHHVRHHLNQLDEEPLVQVMDAFQLSKTELGKLFGVSRQAIDGWLIHGVPAERQEKLNALTSLAEFWGRKFAAGRLPGMARTPADTFHGLTILELVSVDRHRELLDIVREGFDWVRAAGLRPDGQA